MFEKWRDLKRTRLLSYFGDMVDPVEKGAFSEGALFLFIYEERSTCVM
jgi:hypothetical protein